MDRVIKRLERLAKIQVYILLVVYTTLISKSLASILLDFPAFAQVRFLDCYLVGHFRFIGRLDKANKYIGLFLLLASAGYRYSLHSVTDSKFYCLEFLLRGYDEAASSELTANARPVGPGRPGHQPPPGPSTCPTDHHHLDASIIYFVKCRTSHRGRPVDRCLRPCRGATSWLKLSNLALFIFVAQLTSILTFCLFISVAILPTLATRLGYMLSYPNCVGWLRQLDHPARHSAILDLEQMRADGPIGDSKLGFILAYRDFLPLNWFHCIRYAVEVLEILFIDWDVLLSFSVHYLIHLIMIYENYLNQAGIKQRLQQLVRCLTECRKNNHDCLHHTTASNGLASCQMEREISRVQSLLVDHFSTISQYNRYVSYHCSVCITVWFIYTGILCAWLSFAGRGSVRVEFYVAELMIIGLVFMLLVPISFVKHINHRLYAVITSAMALDHHMDTTKLNWITILQHYYPNPMYCYALFGTIEISFLFCLKVRDGIVEQIIHYNAKSLPT